jgi:hypothetical protein
MARCIHCNETIYLIEVIVSYHGKMTAEVLTIIGSIIVRVELNILLDKPCILAIY